MTASSTTPTRAIRRLSRRVACSARGWVAKGISRSIRMWSDRLLARDLGERGQRVGVRVVLQHVVGGPLIPVRVAARPDPAGRIRDVVEGLAKLDARSEQRPARARRAVGHADAAAVDDAVTGS